MRRDTLLRHFPDSGPCLLCGHSRLTEWNASHRLIDAIRSRWEAGDSIRSLAADYKIPRAVVQYVATVPLRELDFLRRRR